MKKRFLLCLLAMVFLLSTACADELHQLSEPQDLGWGKYHLEEDQFADYPGMIACRVTDLAYDHKIEIEVYRKGEFMSLHRGVWSYRTKRANDPIVVDHDFINNGVDLPSGDYYYMMRAMGDGETTQSSAWITSDVWTYVRPEKQLAAPVNLRWSDNVAWWDPVPDEDVGGYCFQFYYSAENGDLTSRKDTDQRIVGFVRYRMSGYTDHCWGLNMDFFEEPGYYYFTVNTVSADMTRAVHSEQSVLSPAIYWNGTALIP